ncbi:MAG: flavin reductase [Neisseriaceae bacterium]|nr:flavin reductase [Neisseriaceae bacterium]
MDALTFRDAMSFLSGAVNIITTNGPSGRHGFTASAVCSVTDQPPTLLVCMNNGSASHVHFQNNAFLSVNVLRAGHEGISQAFANRHISMEERFAAGAWTVLQSGAPILTEALVNFDCRIVASHEVGTHTIFYSEVLAVRCGEGDDEAQQGLVYFNRRYHHVGKMAQVG